MTSASTIARPASAPLGAIVMVLLTGVMTGAQLGKVAPLIPWYQDGIGLSLVATGWLAALLGIFIALAALPAGVAIERIGLIRSLVLGGAVILAGASWLALATAPWAIFAARLVEALGYLSLCIVLPAILNQLSPLSWKGPVLAIWSGFVPLGFATSGLVSATLLPVAGPAGFLTAMAVLFALFWLWSLLMLRGADEGSGQGEAAGLAATLGLPVILITLGFGIFVVQSVSMFTFMPTFVGAQGGHYLVPASVIALSVPLGNVLASVLVGGRNARFMAGLAVAAFAVTALAAIPAFAAEPPLAATAAALALAISGAVVASAQFAAIPFVTPRHGSVPVVIGLVCQAGGIGTVFGPPFAAWVIEAFGWAGFGVFLSATGAAGIAVMLPLLRRSA